MPDFQHSVAVPLPQKPCPYRSFMPLLLELVRGNSAAGPGRGTDPVSRAKVWAELQGVGTADTEK